MKKLSIALALALVALGGGLGSAWADDAGKTVQAP
jgi:hypothetical protein